MHARTPYLAALALAWGACAPPPDPFSTPGTTTLDAAPEVRARPDAGTPGVPDSPAHDAAPPDARDALAGADSAPPDAGELDAPVDAPCAHAVEPCDGEQGTCDRMADDDPTNAAVRAWCVAHAPYPWPEDYERVGCSAPGALRGCGGLVPRWSCYGCRVVPAGWVQCEI